jgi:hypothetical protein
MDCQDSGSARAFHACARISADLAQKALAPLPGTGCTRGADGSNPPPSSAESGANQYDLNPVGFNPLRQILTECIDFKRLSRAPIKLFVTATNVRTGQGRVFRNDEITPDALLASACLPTLFQAVEIDGENYWDGGYSGNPTLLHGSPGGRSEVTSFVIRRGGHTPAGRVRACDLGREQRRPPLSHGAVACVSATRRRSRA